MGQLHFRQSRSVHNMKFTISEQDVRSRKRNVLWGLAFSLGLAGIVSLAHAHDPGTYNKVLLLSVIGFVVLANAIAYFRHLRYLRLIKDHWLEIQPGIVRFWTKGQASELQIADVAALRFFKRRGTLAHIQIQLRNGRGIRLEGYRDMQELKRLLTEQVPAAHIMDD